jgi:hypothetical protein
MPSPFYTRVCFEMISGCYQGYEGRDAPLGSLFGICQQPHTRQPASVKCINRLIMHQRSPHALTFLPEVHANSLCIAHVYKSLVEILANMVAMSSRLLGPETAYMRAVSLRRADLSVVANAHSLQGGDRSRQSRVDTDLALTMTTPTKILKI